MIKSIITFLKDVKLSHILGIVALVLSFYVTYLLVDFLKVNPEKKEFEKKIEALEKEIEFLKQEVYFLEGEYNAITTLPEKNQIITIKTKYEKDSIFIRYAPVSVADSIIRAKLNSIP